MVTGLEKQYDWLGVKSENAHNGRVNVTKKMKVEVHFVILPLITKGY
jgi:hypothetical protein